MNITPKQAFRMAATAALCLIVHLWSTGSEWWLSVAALQILFFLAMGCLRLAEHLEDRASSCRGCAGTMPGHHAGCTEWQVNSPKCEQIRQSVVDRWHDEGDRIAPER